MPNTNIHVPISEAKSYFSGTTLDKDIASSFEEAYSSFSDRKSKQKNAENTLNEIANILTVTKSNLDQVQNQKWFRRSWDTITGKNKKLERVNHANLVKVQIGALFFLQNLAECNDQLMDTVAVALQRIEDIQIENTKLKGHIVHIIRKYNSRLNQIESHLRGHDEAIASLKTSTRNPMLVVLCVGFLALSIPAFLFSPSGYNIFLPVICLAFSISFIVVFLVVKREPATHVYNTAIAIPPLQKENADILPVLRQLMYNAFSDYVNKNLLFLPIQGFYESNDQLNELYPRLNSKSADKHSFSEIVGEIIKVETYSYSFIASTSRDCSKQFCLYYDNNVKAIYHEYLSSIIGIDSLFSLDHSFKTELGNKIALAYKPYTDSFTALINTRNMLLDEYDRFYKLMHESRLKRFGKDLIEVSTFDIVSPSSDDDTFVANYYSNISTYGQQWDNLASIIFNSLVELNSNTYDEAIRVAISKAEPLFEEFSHQNISLRPLLEQVQNEIVGE